MEVQEIGLWIWTVITAAIALFVARRIQYSKYPITVVIGTIVREASTLLPFGLYHILEQEPTLLLGVFVLRAVLQIIEDLFENKLELAKWGWLVYASAIVGIVLVVEYGVEAIFISWGFAFFGAIGLMLFGLMRQN